MILHEFLLPRMQGSREEHHDRHNCRRHGSRRVSCARPNLDGVQGDPQTKRHQMPAFARLRITRLQLADRSEFLDELHRLLRLS